MRKVSFIFILIALICLLIADIEITTLSPGSEISRLLIGMASPDFSVLTSQPQAFLNTLVFAVCGLILALPAGILLALSFRFRLVRYYCAFVRSIHEIFWAFLFIPLVGLNAFCGILALAVPYAGIFGKVFAEVLQETDQKPLRGLPRHTHWASRCLYFVLPSIWQDVKHYTLYRFECALRTSAVLGFIGLPTLGFHLESAFREGLYSEASAILYIFFAMIGTVHYWMRPKLVVAYVIAAVLLVPKQINFSVENISRFFSYEILPWPMRRSGIADGSFTLEFSLQGVSQWAGTIINSEILPGAVQTLLLTQITLVGSGLLALLFFPWVSKHFFGQFIRSISHYVLVIFRTVPDYILAYVLILILGPSLLPALIALSIHNGAILAQLMRQKTDATLLPIDASKSRINRYLFELIPQVFGQFLAFLFYRWEIIMRESAILGILGIYTLGFYIDSAIAEDKMDTVILIILAMAVLNLCIDSLSQRIRKHLRISIKIA